MISPALGRFVGPALSGPARLVLPLLLTAWLAMFLTACSDQSNAHYIQGAVLGTGYHVTLYADLEAVEVAALEADIQGDLSALERQRSELERIDATAFHLFGPALPVPSRQGVDRWLQVLAVDRLAQRLLAEDATQAVLVEVGGVLRGHGTPSGGGWRLSLHHAGLPIQEESSRVRLQDGALVHRFVNPAPAPLISLASPLAVSVIAADANTAHSQAEILINAGPSRALALANEMDSAARVVVKTVTGIEIHYSRAIEPWLEKSL